MYKKTLAIFATVALMFMSAYALAGTFAQAGQHVDDSAITAMVKAKYAKDKLLNPFSISVETNNAVVKLSGKLDSDTQYERAIVIAESNKGVKDVNAGALQVKDSKRTISDVLATGKIKGLLIKEAISNKAFEGTDVSVETNNGTTYLTGKVKNESQKDMVVKIASSIVGSSNVKEDLTISSQ